MQLWCSLSQRCCKMWHYVSWPPFLSYSGLQIYTACSYHMVISAEVRWLLARATVVGCTCYLSMSLWVCIPEFSIINNNNDHRQCYSKSHNLPCSGACFWGTVWDGGWGHNNHFKVLVHTGFSGGSMDHSLQYTWYCINPWTHHISILYTHRLSTW